VELAGPATEPSLRDAHSESRDPSDTGVSLRTNRGWRLVSTGERGYIVKLVIGIVRPERANNVLEALYRAEVRGVSMSRVQGHGGELDRVETYRGTTVKVELSDKVRFEIAVTDPFVQPTIDAICEGARTGEVGDGKIFVVSLDRAVRIRTGEEDNAAVTPVGA
jgi:nitrogen regulatory protein P-II 1